MSATATINGDRVDLVFSYSPLITNGQNVINLVAEYLYNETQEKPFANLTNQEKLDIVDREISRWILQLANMQRNNKGNSLAAEAYPTDL